MRIVSKLTGGIAAIALVATASGPAAARGWDGGYRHHDHGPSAGAVIGVIAGIGILAAIASSASKKKDEAAQRRYDTPPPSETDRYDPRYDDRGRADDGARYGSRGDSYRYDDARADRGSQDAAVDACVLAARDRASRNGDYAEIRGVTSVSPRGGGWDISGQVEQRSSYRSNDGWQRNFSCAWADGRVISVGLD